MAPAKLQNNDKQAAKPVRGQTSAECETRSTGLPEHHLQEGLSLQAARALHFHGTVDTQCGFPARVPDMSM